MSNSVLQLANQIVALPLEARSFLADKLLESLDGTEDETIAEAWKKDVLKRSAELDAGLETLSEEEFNVEIRAILK